MKVAQNFIEWDATFEELVDVDSRDSYFTSKNQGGTLSGGGLTPGGPKPVFGPIETLI
jgi:hypothetical protein